MPSISSMSRFVSISYCPAFLSVRRSRELSQAAEELELSYAKTPEVLIADVLQELF
jgi:hypothetical protein